MLLMIWCETCNVTDLIMFNFQQNIYVQDTFFHHHVIMLSIAQNFKRWMFEKKWPQKMSSMNFFSVKPHRRLQISITLDQLLKRYQLSGPWLIAAAVDNTELRVLMTKLLPFHSGILLKPAKNLRKQMGLWSKAALDKLCDRCERTVKITFPKDQNSNQPWKSRSNQVSVLTSYLLNLRSNRVINVLNINIETDQFLVQIKCTL